MTAGSGSPAPTGGAAPTGGRLRVEADLHLVIDGQTASLTGDGRLLTLTAAAPGQLRRAAAGLPLPGGARRRRAVGRLAELLGSQDLAVRLVGPAGEIVRIGAASHSWWGRAAVGSSRIRLGRPRALASLFFQRARTGGNPADR